MQTMTKRSIVYMGTPGFSVVPLRAIHAAGHEVSAVFTQPDRKAGRGKTLKAPEVKTVAEELGLPVYQPERLRDSKVLTTLTQLAPDCIVVAAYAQLLPQEILTLPRFGCKNIHASLLPKYRGGAPVHWSIVNGETETGVSIMHMDRGLDTGDVILSRALTIGPDEDSAALTARLASLGATLMLECLSLRDMGQSLRQPQNHEEASFARNIRKSDGLIDWSANASQVHNLVRGFHPWPGAFSYFRGLRVSIRTTRRSCNGPCLATGHLCLSQGTLWVGTGSESLQILEVTPAGRNSMSGMGFYSGYLANCPIEERRFERKE